MPTRILIISDPIAPPSYAPRVMSMYRYLKEAGQDVVLEAGELRENTSLWQYVGDKLWQQADREFAKKLLKKYPKGRFDVILCSTYYYFPLLTAEKLNKAWGIPYVVDLRDIVEQWGKANYFTTRLPRLGGIEKVAARWYEQRNLKMRNRIMDGAKAVVTISPWHQQHLQSLTHTHVHLIYNGYDEEEMHWEERQTEVFSIAFIGRFMSLELRQPHLLLAALGEMIQEGEIDTNEWRLDLYAEAEKEEEVRALARQYGAERVIAWHAFVARKELCGIMAESAVLLALGCPPEEGQHGILGTKVFEAIGAEKPLLLVPSDEDSLRELIHETGIGCAARDKEEVKAFLRAQYAEWKEKGYTRKCIEGKEAFSRKKEAAQISGILRASYAHPTGCYGDGNGMVTVMPRLCPDYAPTMPRQNCSNNVAEIQQKYKQTRDNCINLLRFVFSMVVVLHHWIDVTMVDLPTWVQDMQSRMTSFAILGFFILSGYLIIQSYEHCNSNGEYFSKRARRILPPYLLVVLACAFGLVLVSSMTPSAYFRSRDWWMYLVANLSFLNFIHPTLPGVFESELMNDASVNPALWTLKIEVGFYLILPLIGVMLKRAKSKQWLILMGLYALSIGYYIVISRLMQSHETPMLNTLLHQLPGMLCYFVGGMIIYSYRDMFLRYKNLLLLPALIVYIVEEIAGIVVLSPLAIGVIVMWAAFTLKKWDKIIRWGDASYGMYVYHAPILKLLIIAGLFAALPAYCAVPIYVAIVFGVSVASWHLMEKRILRRK